MSVIKTAEIFTVNIQADDSSYMIMQQEVNYEKIYPLS